jgi:hypothetical protein
MAWPFARPPRVFAAVSLLLIFTGVPKADAQRSLRIVIVPIVRRSLFQAGLKT